MSLENAINNLADAIKLLAKAGGAAGVSHPIRAIVATTPAQPTATPAGSLELSQDSVKKSPGRPRKETTAAQPQATQAQAQGSMFDPPAASNQPAPGATSPVGSVSNTAPVNASLSAPVVATPPADITLEQINTLIKELYSKDQAAAKTIVNSYKSAAGAIVKNSKELQPSDYADCAAKLRNAISPGDDGIVFD